MENIFWRLYAKIEKSLLFNEKNCKRKIKNNVWIVINSVARCVLCFALIMVIKTWKSKNMNNQNAFGVLLWVEKIGNLVSFMGEMEQNEVI